MRYNWFLIIFKTMGYLILLIGFFITSLLIQLLVRDEKNRRNQFIHNCTDYNRWSLKLLNIKIKIINEENLKLNSQYLVVSNHLSFLDSMFFCALQPTVFVTSIEMKNTPFLGWITRVGGCVYVERRDRSKIQDELQEMVRVLKQGFKLVIYPEARSTDGRMVYPFKRTLVMSAALADVPVVPVTINYRRVNGQKMSAQYRDHLFWYDHTPFIQLMLRILSLKSVEVELAIHKPYYIEAGLDKAQIAEKLTQKVSEGYDPIP